ncbi:MAG: argininosuccinate lyase [Bacteroidales bacterium]|nr:argininosuccinate lyase [Bacteroidales bacterium]
MKLWDKEISTEQRILAFTTGKDPVYDLELAPYDVAGSMAHTIMLAEAGLIGKEEAAKLVGDLQLLYQQAREGRLTLEPGVEDIHSQVEMMLTRELGDLGKKIHTGRSRNDQVMVDIKLFLRDEIKKVVGETRNLAKVLLRQAEVYSDVMMPGYTHMQVAMPSSFGLWLGGYAEALADDLTYLQGIHSVVNQNPLGSAAGFGSSFPVNRELTTRLLGFENMHISSVNAQMNRGKTEWYVGTGIAGVASTLARFAMDAVLFMGQNFGFISLPPELTTGSSIMPHKKNPDVLELLRAKCNRLTTVASEVSSVTGNLISGYHRDFQVLKEIIHPALDELYGCLEMMQYVVEQIQVNEKILEDDTYLYIYSVEEVNKKVKEGIPFRDAYQQVASDIDKGRYRPGRDHAYTHLGSIGNPGLKEIEAKLDKAYGSFRFINTEKVVDALNNYYEKS